MRPESAKYTDFPVGGNLLFIAKHCILNARLIAENLNVFNSSFIDICWKNAKFVSAAFIENTLFYPNEQLEFSSIFMQVITIHPNEKSHIFAHIHNVFICCGNVCIGLVFEVAAVSFGAPGLFLFLFFGSLK